MQGGESIGNAWLESVWYANNDNHPSVSATGADANDCWNRIGMNVASVQTTPDRSAMSAGRDGTDPDG